MKTRRPTYRSVTAGRPTLKITWTKAATVVMMVAFRHEVEYATHTHVSTDREKMLEKSKG